MTEIPSAFDLLNGLGASGERSLQSSMTDLALDSLELVELMARLEDVGIAISFSELSELESIASLQSLIARDVIAR